MSLLVDRRHSRLATSKNSATFRAPDRAPARAHPSAVLGNSQRLFDDEYDYEHHFIEHGYESNKKTLVFCEKSPD